MGVSLLQSQYPAGNLLVDKLLVDKLLVGEWLVDELLEDELIGLNENRRPQSKVQDYLLNWATGYTKLL